MLKDQDGPESDIGSLVEQDGRMKREDAISRQAVLDAITEIDDNTNMDIYTNEVREIINALPSVTSTRKKGKWMDSVYSLGFTCNCCLTTQTSGCRYKFCPNCGAEMESEE